MGSGPGHADRLTVPGRLTWAGDKPVVTFVEIDREGLDETFWDQTLSANPRVVKMAVLDDVEVEVENLKLAGAIHHMTRCGSTLLTRQFSALPGVVALSEPFIFQHLLEGPIAPPDVTIIRLRKLAALHRDAVAPVAAQWVVKWPSLLCHHAVILARALPETPAIFLHRAALEVMASIEASPLGGRRHVLPRHLATGRSAQGLPDDPLELWAWSLAGLCEAVARESSVQAVDYADLPDIALGRIAAWFGFALTAQDKAAMRHAAQFDAKSRGGFLPDGLQKREGAGEWVRALAEQIVEPARNRAVGALPDLKKRVTHGTIDA
jgi:hypothetical protein